MLMMMMMWKDAIRLFIIKMFQISIGCVYDCVFFRLLLLNFKSNKLQWYNDFSLFRFVFGLFREDSNRIQLQNGRMARTKWFACCVIYFKFWDHRLTLYLLLLYSLCFDAGIATNKQKKMIRLWSHYSLNLIEFIVHFTSFVISSFEIKTASNSCRNDTNVFVCVF